MKTIWNKTIVLSVLSLFLLFISCIETGTYDADHYVAYFLNSLETDLSSLQFDKNGGSQTVRITCNSSWSASSNQSWLSFSPSSGTGSATMKVTATANTGGQVRSSVITISSETNDISLSVSQDCGLNGIDENHEWVNLGLPSGLLWATMNIGASVSEECGDHFAWGETEAKSNYNWSTYKWCDGNETNFTKYNANNEYGTVDNRSILEKADDAAYVNWGGNWRMPTNPEWIELRKECTWTWTSQGGIKGYEVASKSNGTKIFLPSTGYRWDTAHNNESDGFYWSSSLCSLEYTWIQHFNAGEVSSNYIHLRSSGCSIRPVRNP